MTQAQARVFGIYAFLALAISVAALAAKPVIGAPDIADPNISASAIQWQSSVAYERLILTVSGPEGFALSKEFQAGRAAVLRVQELGAKVPADGHYTWELRAVPRISAETKRQLAAARQAGDEEAVARIQAEAGLNRDLVRSGAFAIQSGSFVVSAGEEPAPPRGGKVAANALKPAPLDVVTADDAIIQGSLCVGLDCVNNESFGFDTIRLKENNTRIRFDDTSTAAGFPSNDWQLTANDSASGGASKFSIDDSTAGRALLTVTAGAPANSIFVASNGKVGFRTATPVLDLHVTTSDTPAIRQEQTVAGGFTAQTWDIGANEANWFIRDVTGGSRLPLRIRPGAPTSSIDISASGNVGVGTASPSTKLHVLGSDPGAQNPALGLTVENNGTFQLRACITANRATFGSTNATPIDFISNGWTSRMTIATDGNIGFGGVISPANPLQHSNGAFLSAGGVWTNASSRDFKENICTLDSDEAKRTLEGLIPVTFSYKIDPREHHVGFIAEDAPDIVASKDHKGMSAMDIVAVLTKVVQEQQMVIGELSQRVEQLEKDAQKSHN